MMNSVLTYAAAPSPMRRTSATKGVWAFGIAALLAVACPDAFAADALVRGPGPVRGPAAVAPYMTPTPCYNCNYYYNWTGFYIGANVGGAWETGTLTDDFFRVSFSNTRSGFIGGGQIGYNWQISPQFVLGVEWMFDGTDIRSNTDTAIVGTSVISASEKVDWIQTLAARFGWAANNWLFYAKAGGGWVHDSATLTLVVPGNIFSATASDTRGGWLVGAGIEYGFTPNWTVRLEWDHLGLDDLTHTGVFSGDTIILSRRFDLLTVGLNYRFTGF
jgi:outer membrane immunogenic protein